MKITPNFKILSLIFIASPAILHNQLKIDQYSNKHRFSNNLMNPNINHKFCMPRLSQYKPINFLYTMEIICHGIYFYLLLHNIHQVPVLILSVPSLYCCPLHMPTMHVNLVFNTFRLEQLKVSVTSLQYSRWTQGM